MPEWLKDNHIRFLLVANVVIIVVAALATHGLFLDSYNVKSMAKQLPELGLLAMGIMLAMISGEGGIDLSVIGIANLAAIVAGLTARTYFGGKEQGLSFMFVFIAVALAVGIIAGLINGLLISRVGFTAILATLGTSLIFTGLAVAFSGGPAVTLGYRIPFVEIGNGSVFNIPFSFMIFAVAAIVVSFMLNRTAFGLRLYLMGSNPKAARYTGINNKNILLISYMLSGILASLAGIIIASSASSAKWDYGSSYLLVAILIAVMGGINPDGGHGRMAGLVLATIAMQMMSSSLNLLGASVFLKNMMWGLLLLLSIVFTSAWKGFDFKPKKQFKPGGSSG